MAIFKKLKDVLFDVEEDDELPIITEEVSKPAPKYKEENTIKEIKLTEEDKNDKTMESTFNFPIDFDEETHTRQKKNEYEEMSRDYVSLFAEEEVVQETPKKTWQTAGTTYEPEPRPSRTFKASPIISPVYGVLDQNYSKDDIVVKTDIGVKGPNLDEVRKKAYGLEEKEKKVTPSEFDDSLKTLDEILMEKDTGEITLPKKKEDSVISNENNLKGNITSEDIEKLTEPPLRERNIEEDTLESDLFNLIDSMYEDREEREEK